jgi:hypothetical protein
VSLIWRQKPDREEPARPSIVKALAHGPHCDAEPISSQSREHDGVLDQVKAKPLRGGPAGQP